MQPPYILARMPSGAAGKRIWTILVVLAPVALAVGIWLIFNHATTSKLRLAAGRADVAALLHAEAGRRGWNTDGWRTIVDLRPDNSLHHYVTQTASAEERNRIEMTAPPIRWRARLVSASKPSEVVSGDFDKDGRLIAYRVPRRPGMVTVVPADAAREAAWSELRRRAGADSTSFTLAAEGINRDAGSVVETRRFTFRRVHGEHLTIEAAVETAGLTPVAFVPTPRIAPDYVKQHPELRSGWKIGRGVVAALVTLTALIYLIFRFVVRLREQEIPLKRSAIVALIVVLSFAVVTSVTMATQQIEAIDASGPTRDVGSFIGVAVVAIFAGILLGLTWGACEADLREAYPDKLTSTDAALAGLLGSPPVRTSVAVALVLACYAVMLSGVEAWLRSRLGIWTAVADGELVPFMSTRPALSVIFMSLTGLTFFVAALMAAISITHRRGTSRRAQIVVSLLVASYLIITLTGNHSVIGWSLVPALTAAALLLVPFFVGDLLAVILVSIVSTWAVSSASLLAQPAASLHSAGWSLLIILCIIVTAGAVAAFRVRATNIEAVRPEYAKNISLRLSLAAELSTAREAQLRVMPRVVPTIPGVDIAVRHSDDKEIGTDYFEVFPAAKRIGFAVADARLEGLSSALCISMLKGLLLNYTERLSDPEETIARVRRHLQSVFGTDIPLSLHYSVLDPLTAQLRSATLGDAPQAVLVGDTGAHAAAPDGPVDATRFAVVVVSSALRSVAGGETLADALATSARHDPATLAGIAAEHARGKSGSVDGRSWTVVAFRASQEPMT